MIIPYPNETAHLHADDKGVRYLTIRSPRISLSIRIDRDDSAVVESIDWDVPVIHGGDADARRKTCESCEHKRAIGEMTVACGLCGCGGLRLDGAAKLCRAGKW